MVEKDNCREILSAALSAHVSEIRIFWRETGISCRWLVPDGVHCLVDEEAVRHLKAFKEKARDTIVSESVCEMWLEKCAPLVESDEIGVMPFPLRTLTWLLRVIESPHRDDMEIDSWNLYLWSVRVHELPSHIMQMLQGHIEIQAKQALIDFDTLMTRFAESLDAIYPTDSEKIQQTEQMTLMRRFDRLRRFRNLVFYGAANIGKANLSKQLLSAWHSMTGREIGMHCVTVFHSNTSYENMVERRVTDDYLNVRPTIDHCAPRVIAHHIADAKYFFEPYANDDIQEGQFLTLCRAAAFNPDKDYVFIIDNIDESYLEDVFGEVSHMFDSFARVPWKPGSNGGAWNLEAPGARSIRLSQSNRVFFIPANVYIIGTAIEANLFEGKVDDHLFQTFAVEYMQPKSADELRDTMLTNRSKAAYARLEQYVGHSVELWKQINEILVAIGGHRNIIGYGPLLSMCEEILASSDVHDANRLVLGTWRYRMLPPIRAKMELMLHGTEPQRRALEMLIECLNQSWLRVHIEIEGLPGSESIYMSFESEFVL